MSIFKHCARASVSILALAAMTPAFAQSTGSQVFDQPEIIVTGAKGPKQVDGVSIPDSPKTRQVLTQALITHQTPGQTINDIINLVPGVSFQNNDGYGAGGGFLTIRGFDQSRISETFDGIPLNDTGNYALYSNQQLDPELIDQVAVSLGSTDIDSPTPSATGSTVNYVSRTPTDDFHVRLQGTIGAFDMMRIFGVVDTGTFTKFGTKAWLSASEENYRSPFNNIGKLRKDQANFKVYQPIGSGGDFISVAGNWNDNRNNFSASVPLRTDTTVLNTTTGAVTGPRTVGTGTANGFPSSFDNEQYMVAACTRPTPSAAAGAAGVQTETSSSCGTSYDYRYNPSRTGNIRVNSRFGITDKMILTVDPFYEYTDANGGGTVVAHEGAYTNAAKTFTGYGYIGGAFYVGRDLNGDGDARDTVDLLAPSNTITNRYGVIANLIYNLTPSQTFRINYTLDYGHHRQTGEANFLDQGGHPLTVFPQGDPIPDGNGNVLQKRDRLSLAILNQVAGQYRGKFFDDKLTVEAGARAAFFQRKLHNFCFATNGSGNVDCLDENDAANAAYAAANPYVVNPATGVPGTGQYAVPQKRNFHFNKVLPSAGLTYQLANNISVYGSYSKGLQVPGTDQLYNGFYYPTGTQPANPKPETSDNFDAGVRMRSGKVQAQFAGWYTIFKNRIEQNYDPIAQLSTYTNLGTVHKYGFDGSLAYNVIPQLSLYVFGSYLHSKILDDVQVGTCGATGINTSIGPNVSSCTAGSAIFAPTAGKRESNAPTYTFGGRAEGHVGPFELGVQVKRTGPRYINDQNTPVYQSYGTGAGTIFYQVFGAKTPSYTLVDLDARLSLKAIGMNDSTWLQFNVTNLTNKFYVGASSTGNATPSNTTVNFFQIGAPRTISGTINFGF